MKARRWVLFIGINIIVSVLTTLAVLSLKGELERVVVVTATAGPLALGSEPPITATAQVVESTTTPIVSLFLEHAVQTGDTLGGIALIYDIPLANLLLANNLKEDDIIKPGQVLVIPQGDVVTPTPVTPSPIPSTATPSAPTPLPAATPTPPGPVEVRIQEVLAAGNLAREAIVLVNRDRTVNLQGWTLGAAGGDEVFVFPRLTLAQEIPVTLYTIAGDDTPQALHWGLGEAQWSESGMVIELRDAEGDLVATYTVP
jgi:LysM repeat protein